MYGIITCSGCGKSRIIDLSDGVTVCPYCGRKSETKKANVLYQNEKQSDVRAAFDSMTGFVQQKRPKGEDKDPLSTLAYRIDHTPEVDSKMSIISEELTKILGTFTVDDVEDLVPGKGKQYVKAMLDACMIYEVDYGRYKA